MDILQLIKEGLRISRTSKALWLFGFFVGVGTATDIGNKHRSSGPLLPMHFAPHATNAGTALLAIGLLVFIAAGIFMYFVSAGALIEGVTRGRRGKPPTLRESWGHGLSHWGVLLRIAALYIVANAASLALLATPFMLALEFSGKVLAVLLAIPGALIAVPLLVTLYVWQAFASRIAVLENRHAIDAAVKARLFLHGRLLQGLRLIIAAILAQLVVLVVGSTGLVIAALLVVGALQVLGLLHAGIAVIVLAAVALLPIAFILFAISGTARSSIWTIGYLQEQPQ